MIDTLPTRLQTKAPGYYTERDGGEVPPAAPANRFEQFCAPLDRVAAAKTEFEDETKDPKTRFDAMVRMTRAKEEAAAELGADEKTGIVLMGRGNVGAMATPRMDGGKGWRLSYFTKTGFTGHRDFASKAEAVKDALMEGHTTEAKATLQEWRKGPDWRTGEDDADMETIRAGWQP